MSDDMCDAQTAWLLQSGCQACRHEALQRRLKSVRWRPSDGRHQQVGHAPPAITSYPGGVCCIMQDPLLCYMPGLELDAGVQYTVY